MWIAFKERLPTEAGWILISTNIGVGIAMYDPENNKIRELHTTSGKWTTKVKCLHWAELPAAPIGDYDPDAGGFQKHVN